jgi:hypothetical protein
MAKSKKQPNPPLTALALLLAPGEVALLGVRGKQIEEMMGSAHVPNALVGWAMGMGCHQLVGLALPIIQMVAFSAFLLMSPPGIRRRHQPLRLVAGALMVTASLAELAVSVPPWQADTVIRLLVTLTLMLADLFGGALLLEHLVVPAWPMMRRAIQKRPGWAGVALLVAAASGALALAPGLAW